MKYIFFRLFIYKAQRKIQNYKQIEKNTNKKWKHRIKKYRFHSF